MSPSAFIFWLGLGVTFLVDSKVSAYGWSPYSAASPYMFRSMMGSGYYPWSSGNGLGDFGGMSSASSMSSGFFPGSSSSGLTFVPAIPMKSSYSSGFSSRRRYSSPSLYDYMGSGSRRQFRGRGYNLDMDYGFGNLRPMKSRAFESDEEHYSPIPPRRSRMGMSSNVYPSRFSQWRDEDELHRFRPGSGRFADPDDWEEDESRRHTKQVSKPKSNKASDRQEKDRPPRDDSIRRRGDHSNNKRAESTREDIYADASSASSRNDDSHWRPSAPIDIEDFREPEVPPVKGFNSEMNVSGPASRRYSYMGYRQKPRRADREPYMVVHNLLGMNDSGDYRPYTGPHQM